MSDRLSEKKVDTELVQRAQTGDGLALSKLIEELIPHVRRICGPIALENGADAAQEALMQICRDLPALRDPGAVYAWVQRISVRAAIRHAQQARRQPDASPPEIPAAGDPSLAADVRSVLNSLQAEQRAILTLRDIEGLSEQEASAILEVARGTVKSRLHRARIAFLKKWTE